jgi:hypothetical protein
MESSGVLSRDTVCGSIVRTDGRSVTSTRTPRSPLLVSRPLSTSATNGHASCHNNVERNVKLCPQGALHACSGGNVDVAYTTLLERPRPVPKVGRRETRGISAACRCSSHAWVDHQPGYHVAAMGTEAVRLLVLWMAGWIHSRQLEVIDFLREENRVLREQLGGRHLRFIDAQRRRLPVKGQTVGRRRLGEFAGLVTPDTILRWYRELIARKYDGSACRRTGRPTVAIDIEQLVVRMARENPDNLGHQIGRDTIKRVLWRHGLEPAPHAASACRGRRSSARTWGRSPRRTSSRSRCSRGRASFATSCGS